MPNGFRRLRRLGAWTCRRTGKTPMDKQKPVANSQSYSLWPVKWSRTSVVSWAGHASGSTLGGAPTPAPSAGRVRVEREAQMGYSNSLAPMCNRVGLHPTISRPLCSFSIRQRVRAVGCTGAGGLMIGQHRAADRD
jgi:hypothetical protein